MTTLATLVVKIVGDISDYSDAIEKSKSLTNNFASDAINGLSNLGAGIVGAGLGAAALGATALAAETYKALEAAQDAEKIQAQLGAVLKSTGGAAGVTAEMANSLANSLGALTTFEDDAVLAGENILLTFTNIGKDTFPGATQAMVDLSQAMGQDLQSSAVQLGKALNDPIKGVTALQRVGVTFTEDQKKMIEAMVEAGDTAGAQKLILEELNKEFGGSAEAAGNTSSGVWTRMGNIWQNIQETLGGALLPSLTRLGQILAEWLTRPETIAFVQDLANRIAAFAQTVIENIPTVINWFESVAAWFEANKGVIVAALAVISVALLAFAITSIATGISALIGLWPVILVVGLIGAAAYLLYLAWTNNWGGIREKTAEVWAWLEPKLLAIRDWFQTNIPIALKWLADTWQNTLLPAMVTVWNWVETNLFPLFRAIGDYLGVTFSNDIIFLSALWQNALGPALSGVWSILVNNVWPILQTIGEWLVNYFAWGLGNATSLVIGLTNAMRSLTGAQDNEYGGFSSPTWSAENAAQSVAFAQGQQGLLAPVTVNYNDYSMLNMANEYEIGNRLGGVITEKVQEELMRRK